METIATLLPLIESLRRDADRPAILFPSGAGFSSWSRGELLDRVLRLAAGLRARGVARGDRVAIFASNRPEWVAAALAAVAARAVVMPLDLLLESPDLVSVIDRASPRALFATRESAARLEPLGLGAATHVLLLDAIGSDERSWERLLAPSPLALEEPRPEDVAALFHTSGTTGAPKGVPLTHRNLSSNLAALLDEQVIGAGDRLLLPLPLHHVYPFTVGLLTAIATGSPIVLPAGLTGPQIVRALVDGEVTAILGVPRIYDALLTSIDRRLRERGRLAALAFHAAVAASSWARRLTGALLGRRLFARLHAQLGPRVRIVSSGGAPLDPRIARKLEALGWEVATGYGLSETSPILTFNAPGRGRLETAGRPIRGVELRIDAREGEGGGEVLARGPSVFSGYRDDPDRTREAFTDDGWFRTGDLGFLDRAGYLHLVGRASERIVLGGGKKVDPERIESALFDATLLAEVAALECDGRLVALAVPSAGETGPPSDVEACVRAHVQARCRDLPPYERVADVAVTRAPLPRTPLGKLRRHLLPPLYAKARAGRAAATAADLSPEDRLLLEDPIARRTWDWLSARYPKTSLTPDTSPQLDLGIDSLEWVSLTLELSRRLEVDLPEEAVLRIHTVRDLLQEACAAASGAKRAAARSSPLDQPEAVLDERQKRWLRPLGPVVGAVSAALLALHRLAFRAVFRMRVIGIENLPAEAPVVFTPNHVSDLDPFALAAALPSRRLRQTYWAGTTDRLFTNVATRTLSRLVRVVPIDAAAAASSLAFGASVLGRGQSLVWFPEGRRSLTGELEPFQAGIGLLLERFDVAAVPVLIQGTREALPRGRVVPRLRRIKVRFGAPRAASALVRPDEAASPAEQIAAGLHDAVASLASEQQPAASDSGAR
jgi:long-chain acyl-CoA synthetase